MPSFKLFTSPAWLTEERSRSVNDVRLKISNCDRDPTFDCTDAPCRISVRTCPCVSRTKNADRIKPAIAKATLQIMANTSHQLQDLRTHRLVESEKKGLYVTYRIADQNVFEFFSSLRALAESQLAEMRRITDQFFVDREEVEAVDRKSLFERI